MTINISLPNYEELAESAVCDIAPAERRITPQNWVAGLFVVDTLVLMLAGFVPIVIGYEAHLYAGRLARELAIVVMGAVLLCWIFTRLLHVYAESRIFDLPYSVQRICIALAITFAVLLTIGVATKTAHNYPRVWFFSWIALTGSAVPIARILLLKNLHRRFAAGDYVFRAMSCSIKCEPLSADDIREGGNAFIKLVSKRKLEGAETLSQLAPMIARYDIDRIYIAVPWEDSIRVLRETEYLRQFATQVFVVARNVEGVFCVSDANTLGGHIALTAVDRPIHPWGLWMKRVQDIVIASGLLVLFAPIMLVVAAAIRLESTGPILFRQTRVGFNGATFEIWKFRSMFAEMADAQGRRQTSRNDPRVSRVGRIIRRLSLDELPQLFNVLQGTMSVVGPRPHAQMTRSHGEPLERIAELYAARHRVKPGLTGWAQVNGLRGELTSAEKVRKRVDHDMWYIENWSTWLDVRIVMRTALLMFFDRSAY